MLKNFKTTVKERLRNQRGVTLVTLLVAILLIIILAVALNNSDMIKKSNRGGDTAGWSTDLSNLNSSMVSSKNFNNLFYTVTLTNPTTKYSTKVTAPYITAYDEIKTSTINGVGTLTYSAGDIVSFTPSAGTYKVFNYKNIEMPNLTSMALTGISNNGTAGIAPLVNKKVPNIEESIAFGLLGFQGSVLESNYKEYDGEVMGDGKDGSITDIITLAFGDKNTTSTAITASGKNRWVYATPIDTLALKELVGGNSRFLDSSKYRLFWVNDVVNEADFKQIAKTPVNGTTLFTDGDDVLLSDLYDRLTKSVLVDNILVVPQDRSGVTYSSNSDFKYYKFSSAD